MTHDLIWLSVGTGSCHKSTCFDFPFSSTFCKFVSNSCTTVILFTLSLDNLCIIKKIYHECEGRIEKSVPRIAV